MSKFGKTDLIRRITDVVRNGWNNAHLRDLIETLWRDPASMRTSGFVKEGGTNAMIAAEVTSTEIDGITSYAIVFTITPKGKKFDFYHFRDILSYHKKYASENIAFDAEEGLHAVYYDFDEDTYEQVLKHIHNPTHDDMLELMQWVVPITFIYFNATSNEIIYFGDNRHGSWWNPWIHWSWHQTFNSMRETGLEFTDLVADGDGSSDTHAQFGVSEGTCFHEDIYATAETQAAPANFPVWYFISGNRPRISDNSVNSLVVNGLLCYNSGGAAVSATDGWFVMYHIFFTNDILEPFISVMGQAQYEKVSTATLMINSEVQQVKDLLPHQNLLHIGTLVFQTSALFGNSYKSRIVSQAYGVITRWSVEGDGSAATPVQLKNDEETPGINFYYGTDSDGEKGYHPMPEIIELIQGAVTNVKYGNLYNWWAATDTRNIAPAGWHVPTKAEFETLFYFLDPDGDGMVNDAGGKLKEEGTTHWDNPNTGATNEVYFNARGSGIRNFSSGVFQNIKQLFDLWNSDSGDAYYTELVYISAVMTTTLGGFGVTLNPKAGFSIRYIKDDSVNTGTVTGNDGKIYPTVKIGDQVWMACNSAETKYRTGDLISGPSYTNAAWAALTTEAYCIYDDNPENAITEGAAIEHDLTTGKKGGSDILKEWYHHTADEIANHVYEAPIDGENYVRKDGEWEKMPEIPENDSVIEFGFKDFFAGVAQSWDMDINCEFSYTIKHIWLKTDSGTLTGVNVKINNTVVTGLDNITIDSTKDKSTATAANAAVAGDTVTLNITTGYTGAPAYIGGHIYIERT